MAQHANRLFGTAIGPWDVPQLDEPTLDLIRALTVGAPKLEQNIAKVEAAKAKFWQPFTQKRH